ncbi:hypothetical protein ACFL5G_01240 [Candidatus Margulisiibacteriota bacterium]
MRKIALFLVLMLAGLIISGCGVQIKQEGNKIFTDADKDMVYKFSASALETEGYIIKERSRKDGVIQSVPEKDNEIFATIKDDPKVNVYIKERAEENDVMVEIEALISGDVDEKQSTLVARRAVDRLIEELNKYGMFTVTQEGSFTLPAVDMEKFIAYTASALGTKGYTASATDTSVEGRETIPSNEYNEPMMVKIEATPQDNEVSIVLSASIEGNYDRNGNEEKSREAINELISIVENYPVVEKSIQQNYAYVSTSKALAWSKMAMDNLGYVIDSEDTAAKTLTSMKDGLKIMVSVTDAGNNMSAVDVVVSGEGGVSKEALESAADSALTDIKDELAMYQISRSDNKMFTTTPTDKAYRYARNALVGRGYTVTKADQANMVVAGVKIANKNVTAALSVNSLGNEGVAIEVTAYVNGKKLGQADSEALAAKEVSSLLGYLNRYDKMDVK